MNNRPFLIEIEGSDGSGKQTQSTMLCDKLNKLGHATKIISFPMYDNVSSTFVKKYLNGDYGNDPMEIDPYIASLFFAADRLTSYLETWKYDLNSKYKFIILDRYVGSNILHQGSKLSGVELLNYIRFAESFEYEKMKLPKADIVYYLDMPRWASRLLTLSRANKATGESEKDIHESNDEYMNKVEASSNRICKLLHWEKISCVSSSCGTSIGDLSDICSAETINKKLVSDITDRFII